METVDKNKCKDIFNKIKDNHYDYDSFEAGFKACSEALPTNEAINKFMAISNIYAISHPDGWSIRELQDYIREKWDKLKK